MSKNSNRVKNWLGSIRSIIDATPEYAKADQAVRIRYIRMAKENHKLRRVVAPRHDYYAIKRDLYRSERYIDDKRGLPVCQMRVVRQNKAN